MPTTEESAISSCMFFAPWAGSWTPFTASSFSDSEKWYIPPILFASSIAMITPLLVGTPFGASPPDIGRSTPTFTSVIPAAPAGRRPTPPSTPSDSPSIAARASRSRREILPAWNNWTSSRASRSRIEFPPYIVDDRFPTFEPHGAASPSHGLCGRPVKESLRSRLGGKFPPARDSSSRPGESVAEPTIGQIGRRTSAPVVTAAGPPRPGTRGRVRRSPGPLRVDAPGHERVGHAADRADERADPHLDLLLLTHRENVPEAPHQDAFQPGVDLLLGPEERLKVLHPLEVGHDHAAGVGENVRDDEHLAALQHLVRLRCRRTVRPLHDDARLDASGVVRGDLSLHRRRHEDLARQLKQLVVGDRVAPAVPGDAPRLLLVADQVVRIDPLLVVNAPAAVARRDDPAALGVQRLGGDRADVAEALDHRARPRKLQPQVTGGFTGHDRDAAAGGLDASSGPADRDRLPRHDRGHRIAAMHAVGVHDPRHDLGRRPHVGRGDVAVGPHQDFDFGSIAARQVLELGLGQDLGIAHDAALGAAVRQTDHRALPGHQHRQRPDLVQGHIRMVADPALRRAEDRAVVNPVSGEHLDRAILALHRERHGQLAFRIHEELAHTALERQQVRRLVELLTCDHPRIFLRCRLHRLECHPSSPPADARLRLPPPYRAPPPSAAPLQSTPFRHRSIPAERPRGQTRKCLLTARRLPTTPITTPHTNSFQSSPSATCSGPGSGRNGSELRALCTTSAYSPATATNAPTAPQAPVTAPSMTNGHRMNHAVAPTSRITSISVRRANTVSRIVLAMMTRATSASAPPTAAPNSRTTRVNANRCPTAPPP